MDKIFDNVVTTKKIISNNNGCPLIETNKTIICSVCGYANSITTAQCKMCGNYLETEEDNK